MQAEKFEAKRRSEGRERKGLMEEEEESRRKRKEREDGQTDKQTTKR